MSERWETLRRVGRVLDRAGRRLARVGAGGDLFAGFLSSEALRINTARQDHLASLGLPIAGKSVLEVGAGIGLHTRFFEERRCRVLSTDGRPENVSEMRRRYPGRRVAPLNLLDRDAVTALGVFDIVYCYGVLYHLSAPEQVLESLTAVCRELLLLETCVTPGSHFDVHLVRERASFSQAVAGVGCRPTRPWVLEQLRRDWRHAYVPITQPCHPDFELDWVVPTKRTTYRAVFVGAKFPLQLPGLLDHLPDHQECACGRGAACPSRFGGAVALAAPRVAP